MVGPPPESAEHDAIQLPPVLAFPPQETQQAASVEREQVRARLASHMVSPSAWYT